MLEMSIGFRIYKDVERIPRDVVALYDVLPVANIADNMGRLYCVDAAIKAYGKKRMAGPAFTVKAPAGDNLLFHKAIDMAEAGDIVVVSAEGCTSRSLCGELMVITAKAKGIAGFLLDGCIRDAEEISTLDFAVYARGVQPNGPYRNGPGEINVPVAIGGQVVTPGDLIVADGNGVVVIPKADADAVAPLAAQVFANETKKAPILAQGGVDRTWLHATLNAFSGAKNAVIN
jgi:RraA family protein